MLQLVHFLKNRIILTNGITLLKPSLTPDPRDLAQNKGVDQNGKKFKEKVKRLSEFWSRANW